MSNFNFKQLTNSFIQRLKVIPVPSKMVFWVMGIGTTIWFLIRVIPKPQRAGYPCMRAAAPIMSGFFLYIVTLGGASLLFRKALNNLRKAHYLSASIAILMSVILIFVFFLNDVKTIYANTLGITWDKGVLPDAPNSPMGTPWGINPGRVAWAFNPEATNENCSNTIDDAYFMPKNNNQEVINALANKAIRIIGGQATVKASWEAIFTSFNERKSGTAIGYTAGEKIFIKVNNGQAGWAIDSETLAETGNRSATGVDNAAMSNTSPAAVLAFVVQLVDSLGVAQSDIMIGEPMTHVYKSMYDVINSKYPDVIIIDKERSDLGRTKSSGWTGSVIKYSDKGMVMTAAKTDVIMNEMYSANYMINIAALKAHARGGVTFCAKNHFGSHGSHSGNFDSGHLHDGLISIKGNDRLSTTDFPRIQYGMYRVLTDLIGHEKLGLNTVLFVVDGLWSGIEATDMPVKWETPPFNNDWPSSLFVAQDQIALESVCLDFLRAEAEVNSNFKNRPFFPAVDDFLHQGATKANWPDSIAAVQTSTTRLPKWYQFAGYDPEGDGTLMPASLGVHEHWNNSTDKQYSRNIYSNGNGIELVSDPANLIKTSTKEASKTLTVTVKAADALVVNARVTVNGSSHLTDADGKVIIYNLVDAENLTVVVNKKGYRTTSSILAINGDSETTLNLELANSLKKVGNSSTFSAFPNPCDKETEISYYIKSKSKVTLFMIAMDGKIVKQLKNEDMFAGSYNQKVDVSDLTSGSYMFVLQTGNGVSTSRILVK